MFRKNGIALTFAFTGHTFGRPVTFDDPPKIPDELKGVVDKLVADAIAAATGGLKNKNDELLGEIRGLKDKVKTFDGLDPVAIKAMLDKVGNDEEAQLIAKGKYEEAFAKRTERLQADHKKTLDKLEADRVKLSEKNQKLVQKATNEAIILAHAKTGARKEAVEDFILRAKGAGFTIDDDGNVIAKDGEGKPVFGKDGTTPLTPIEWAESLRETASHLWPPAQGSGAEGSHTPAKGGADLSKMTPEARLTHVRTHGAQGAR
jgi:hypothetical protein